jgi:hypothetical protein
MRVETVHINRSGIWEVGLSGLQTERFRRVTLTLDEIKRLQVVRPTFSYAGDGQLLRVGIQAYSLGIAYEFDPYFGLSISRVDPLPHQLEAVYDYLLKFARVRFLLADDAGAGKTIMAGLLIRELKLRGLVERVLIVCQANLRFQWRRELKDKFDEKFVELKGDQIRDQYGTNQWLETPQIITSLDLAKREHILPGLKQVATAFLEGRRILAPDGVSSVVFAHKTTEGWEALLSAMIHAGMVVTGSWPITTEMANRLVAKETASLSTSVHLVCRPRPADAPIGDWSDVLRELPQRVGDWIERLQAEGIKGADLVFACIGPAMEIYSRYRRAEDAEGREIPLGGDPTAAEPYKRGFLAYVWETVGRLALKEVLGTAEAKARNGAAGALEEDSRLTALFLWTLQTTNGASSDQQSANGKQNEERDESEEEDEDDEDIKSKRKKTGYTLIYDVARRFAQPLGIHLDKWEGRIVETEKGIVRLTPVTERAAQLFGEADAAAISRRIEADAKASRNLSFAFMQESATAPEIRSRGKRRDTKHQGGDSAEPPGPQKATTLDRLHAAMLLQRSGQTNGLRALLKDEIQRGPDFLRLANALSRLYPKDSDEKRLLDAMLLAIPR